MQDWVKSMHFNIFSLLRSAVWQAVLMYLHKGDKLHIASRATSQQKITLPGGAFLSFNIPPQTAGIAARGYRRRRSLAHFVLPWSPQPVPGDEEVSPSLLDVKSTLLKGCWRFTPPAHNSTSSKRGLHLLWTHLQFSFWIILVVFCLVFFFLVLM